MCVHIHTHGVWKNSFYCIYKEILGSKYVCMCTYIMRVYCVPVHTHTHAHTYTQMVFEKTHFFVFTWKSLRANICMYTCTHSSVCTRNY